jgi:hypothetical protein
MVEWKPIGERVKAPKGTKVVDISWEEFSQNQSDLVTFFRKWPAAEYVGTKGSGDIFRLPNNTYATRK